ncbi:MAG: hypothetical protein ACM30I_01735 [Gemmatimonas sp.]
MPSLRYPFRRHPVSPLGRAIGQAPLDADQMLALRRRVWRESGIAVMKPEDISDEESRRLLIETANRLFGIRNLRITLDEQDRDR